MFGPINIQIIIMKMKKKQTIFQLKIKNYNYYYKNLKTIKILILRFKSFKKINIFQNSIRSLEI